MNAAIADFSAAEWRLSDEATVLVRRYPQISRDEEERLVSIYPRLPIVQLALMSSDEELAPRLEAFRKANARQLKTPVRDLAALLSPVFLLAIVLAWVVLK